MDRYHQTPADVLEGYATGYFWNARRRVKGTMSDLLRADMAEDHAVVGWCLPVRCQVTDDARAALVSREKEIRFPRDLEPALAHMTTTSHFEVGSLWPYLDKPGRKLLVSTLIREGLLAISRLSNGVDGREEPRP